MGNYLEASSTTAQALFSIQSAWDSGTVNILGGWQLRSAPQKRHRHPEKVSGCTIKNPSNRDGGERSKSTVTMLVNHLVTLSCSDWEGHKHEAKAVYMLLLECWSTGPEAAQAWKYIKPQRLASRKLQQSSLEPKQHQTGKAHIGWGQTPVAETHCGHRQC